MPNNTKNIIRYLFEKNERPLRSDFIKFVQLHFCIIYYIAVECARSFAPKIG